MTGGLPAPYIIMPCVGASRRPSVISRPPIAHVLLQRGLLPSLALSPRRWALRVRAADVAGDIRRLFEPRILLLRARPAPRALRGACASARGLTSCACLRSQCGLMVYGSANPAPVSFAGAANIGYNAPALSSTTYQSTGVSLVVAPTQARDSQHLPSPSLGRPAAHPPFSFSATPPAPHVPARSTPTLQRSQQPPARGAATTFSSHMAAQTSTRGTRWTSRTTPPSRGCNCSTASTRTSLAWRHSACS